LEAEYNTSNSAKVLHYINSSLKPGGQPDQANDYFDINTRRIDVTTILSDKTEFYIKESPGKLKIALDKNKNSTASYYRIKKMCEGIQGLLAGR
jgi:hypothetical protein